LGSFAGGEQFVPVAHEQGFAGILPVIYYLSSEITVF
jgi:hypothetical protein